MSSKPDLPDNLLCKKTQAAESNKKAILKVLEQELSINATVLEIGSGTGQHAATFCTNLPTIDWTPSDLNNGSFESITSCSNSNEGFNCTTACYTKHLEPNNIDYPLKF